MIAYEFVTSFSQDRVVTVSFIHHACDRRERYIVSQLGATQMPLVLLLGNHFGISWPILYLQIVGRPRRNAEIVGVPGKTSHHHNCARKGAVTTSMNRFQSERFFHDS